MDSEQTGTTLLNYMRSKGWLLSLFAMFFAILFMTSYFNADVALEVASDGSITKYYAGTDPYYHDRTVQYIQEHHVHQDRTEIDPLLNYPVGGANPRPPLFSWIVAVAGMALAPLFGGSVETATTYMSMFISPLSGALLVFGVFFLANGFFGRKIGLIAALLYTFMPAIIGGDHGAVFGLFDWDIFLLLLWVISFYYLVRALKTMKIDEWVKNWRETATIVPGIRTCIRENAVSLCYALLSGIFLGALALAWEGWLVMLAIITLYFIAQVIVNQWRHKDSLTHTLIALTITLTAVLLSLPYWVMPTMAFFFVALIFIVGALMTTTRELPGVLVLSSLAGIGALTAGVLLAAQRLLPTSPLAVIANNIFGGITYIQASKVYLTIGEAANPELSLFAMYIGGATFLLAFAALGYIIYKTIRSWQSDQLLLIIWAVVMIYMAWSALRFVVLITPIMAILAAYALLKIYEFINLGGMVKTYRTFKGSLFQSLRKSVKIKHIIGVFFLVFMVTIPNVWLTVDSAIPFEKKSDYDENGTFLGAFGLTTGKERLWTAGLEWLATQDADLPIDERPGVISWWDYGFYTVDIGKHPAVADNFQNGIEPAGNFITATSEAEAIAVLSVRLLEADWVYEGPSSHFSDGVMQTITQHLGANDTATLVDVFANPVDYAERYGFVESGDLAGDYNVRPANAIYRESVATIMDNRTEDAIVGFYHDLQAVTGHSIRYYATEGYDFDIFTIFIFLSDKGERGNNDYIEERYQDQYGRAYTMEDIEALSPEQLSLLQFSQISPQYKQAFFESMFYRAYYGTPTSGELPEQVLPAYGMKHFRVVYRSVYWNPFEDYASHPNAWQIVPFDEAVAHQTNNEGVIDWNSEADWISNAHTMRMFKYYEGAYINGTLKTADGAPIAGATVVVYDDAGVPELNMPNIPHDIVVTDQNGEYSLLAPFGEVTVSAISTDVLLASTTFNSTTDAELMPITDDESMRVDGTNYERTLNLTVDYATVMGTVYDDRNGNGTYDAGIDTPLANTSIVLTDQITQNVVMTTTAADGTYTANAVVPGKYTVTATTDDGYVIHEADASFWAGNVTYNITMPTESSLSGIVYVDRDSNDAYSDGELLVDGATVSLIYTSSGATAATTTTDAAGAYALSDIIPGDYTIAVTRFNATLGFDDYSADQAITIGENATLTQNVSAALYKAQVTGIVTSGGVPVTNVSIGFSRDVSVVGNTAAVFAQTAVDGNGTYIIGLPPGTYAVIINQSVNESGSDVIYSFEGALSIVMGETTKTYDIAATRTD